MRLARWAISTIDDRFLRINLLLRVDGFLGRFGVRFGLFLVGVNLRLGGFLIRVQGRFLLLGVGVGLLLGGVGRLIDGVFLLIQRFLFGILLVFDRGFARVAA